MPCAQRVASGHDRALTREETRGRAIAALTADDLASIVDLVVWVDDVDGARVAHAANHLGTVRLRPRRARGARRDRPHRLGGSDGVPAVPARARARDRGPARPTPTRMRRSGSFRCSPTRPAAPTWPSSTRRAYFPDDGGHHGEHGSLDVVQSRAPLVLAGAGSPGAGTSTTTPTSSTSARPWPPWPACHATTCATRGRAARGRVLDVYLDPAVTPRAVVGPLGRRALQRPATPGRSRAGLPAVARLIERGLALRGGAVAQFPSVTLTNHTSILTGTGPGRHGVLGNVFYDRETDQRVVPNDETTWHRSAEWLRPGCARSSRWSRIVAFQGFPRTVCIDEAIDKGSDYSTMQVIRESGSGNGAGGLGDRLPGRAVPVPGRPDLPRRRLLPLGRQCRRPGARPDARPVRRCLSYAAPHVVGERGDRRRSPRRWSAVRHGPRLLPPV